MTDLVERLAERFRSEVVWSYPLRWLVLGNPRHVRWWLNAVADELRAQVKEVESMTADPTSRSFDSVARWLRTQGEEDS